MTRVGRRWVSGLLLAAGLWALGPPPGAVRAQAQQQPPAVGLGLVPGAPPAAMLAPSLSAPRPARAGEATEAEAGATVPQALGAPPRPPGPAGMPTAVFGAALFTGQPAVTSDAANPNYVIAPGDRVSVRVWGPVEAEAVGQVDGMGMLFLPNIGPVRLAGTRAGDLQRAVEAEVRRVFNPQVQVYAVLLSTQRIGVFVTGFVRTPGRFGGSAADSVLDFLVRAGGVDASRGSFRDIAVLRGGNRVASVDLYRFLLDGRLPPVRLQEGDTILVGAQRALVAADGSVRNNFLFEVPGRAMTGAELMELARPLPAATNAIVAGSRGGRPFSRYATLQEFRGLTLSDQDVVTFITDSPAQTVRVTVEGSRVGPSVLVADRDTSLCDLLDHIEVDPRLADTQSVFLLRPSVAEQQRRTIDESLDRLERQLFLAVSPTQGVANIRSAEAQMVANFIQRARRTRPEGRVVVFQGGRCSPLRVEDGDTVVIPNRVQTVMVAGEVQMPRAVVWAPNLSVEDYVRQAGGFTPRGNASNLMIRRASGELILDPREGPRPGDEVIALPRLDPKFFQMATDFTQLIFQLAFAARAVRFD